MIIKNRKELEYSKTRKDILENVETGIESVMPSNIIKQNLSYNKNKRIIKIKNKIIKVKGRIFIVGFGKACSLMAKEVEKVIPPKEIEWGYVNSNISVRTKKIFINIAQHPLPGKGSIRGAKEILAMKEKFSLTKDDIIICLISGGGSSLIEYPVKGINLRDIKKINDYLIKSGASIEEINIVRKHLSEIKGGKLSNKLKPAKIYSLIISDVIKNDISTIASGPTYKDISRKEDAKKIINKYIKNQKEKENYIKKLSSTSKTSRNSNNIIVAENMDLLNNINMSFKKQGYESKIITDKILGNTTQASKKIVKLALKIKKNVLIFGGETTPKIDNKKARGGRCQELAIAIAKDFPKDTNFTIACIASDGKDFIKGIAGAIVSSEQSINKKEADMAIKNHKSYDFLKKLKHSIIKSENSGTNVRDLYVIIKETNR